VPEWRLTARQLVSSIYLTAFSDHRFPADSEEFVTPEAYVAYMQSYVANFGLAKHIECSTRVLEVSRTNNGRHVVKILKQATAQGTDGCQWIDESWECDAVVVCSGLNVYPNIPDIAGLPPMTAKSDALSQVSITPKEVDAC
jgi:dimethylaniline monooxygenase (N-oxide forming)